MNAKDAIHISLKNSEMVMKMFLSDLSDADLLVRPVPNANHSAWQLGHIIASEARFHKDLPGSSPPQLPPGFAEKHTKETATVDSASSFCTKAQYLEAFETVRAATHAALDKVTDADLETPTKGPMADFVPNLAAMFLLMGAHVMMHAGQFTVVRRKLGKPVLF